MTIRKKYEAGEFCWTELGTTDAAGAKKFYKGIFGWTSTEFPMGVGDEKYSIMSVGGKDVGGLYPLSATARKKMAKPSWLPYISVKSAAKAVAKAKAAGAKVIDGATDVGEMGRMATMKDPSGAQFAVWESLTYAGAGLEDRPGSMMWHDLSTKKTDVAGKFYSKVFGWKIVKRDFGGNAYFEFKLGKESVCGMWPMPMSSLPPFWVTHWKVENCARTVTKAKRLGGSALMGATAVPGMGHFAILADPQGAVFGIIGK